MNSTALGAENNKKQTINFISEACRTRPLYRIPVRCQEFYLKSFSFYSSFTSIYQTKQKFSLCKSLFWAQKGPPTQLVRGLRRFLIYRKHLI